MIKPKTIDTVERERERESYTLKNKSAVSIVILTKYISNLKEIKTGRNTFICHIKQADYFL